MKNTRNITAFYALIQALYWMTFGMMFSFASTYLLDWGFTNSQIGIVLGAAYALSACAQPLIATFFNRSGIRLSSGLAGIYCLIALLCAALLILPLHGWSLAAFFIAILMLQSSLQPSINSLQKGYELNGVAVNFSFARGVGSAAFSVVCAIVGRLLQSVSPRILPALYLSTVILLIICLLLFRSPSFIIPSAAERVKRPPLLKRYPRFSLFLLGLVCLSMAHIFIDNFLIQIMQSVGGGSAEQGVAIAIAGVTEFPAMVFYGWMSRKTDGRRLLRLAAWVWVAKDLMILLARSPEAIYAASLLQFASFAFYVPATVDYVSRTLPQEDFLKGQALSGTAFTLGSLAASFIGGTLLDLAGVRGALTIVQVFAILGAVLFTIAIPCVRRRKEA